MRLLLGGAVIFLVMSSLTPSTVFGLLPGDLPPILDATSPLATTSRSGEPSVCGFLTWGESGSVRFEISARQLANSKRGNALVDLTNEGSLPLILDKRDLWEALVGDEPPIKLRATRWSSGAEKEITNLELAPNARTSVYLSIKKPVDLRNAKIRFSSGKLHATVLIDHEFVRPHPVRIVAPSYPLKASGFEGVIEAAVRVAADGSVEDVITQDSKGRSSAGEPHSVVRKAIQQWTFSPALVDGKPTRALFSERFSFDAPNTVRISLPLTVSELAPRLRPLLDGIFTQIAALPSVNGYFIVGKPFHDDRSWGVHGVSMRYGAEPGGGSWISISAQTLFLPSQLECQCHWRTPSRGVSEKLADWIESGLGVQARDVRYVAPVVETNTPSGWPEPLSDANWNQEAIDEAMGLALSRVPPLAPAQAGTPELHITDSPQPLPSEPAFLSHEVEPELVEGEVSAPELVHKISPYYPDSARRGKLEGTVILEAILDEKGRIRNLGVLRSIPAFDSSALAAVCCWRYKPAMRGNQPVKVYFTVVIDYSLR